MPGASVAPVCATGATRAPQPSKGACPGSVRARLARRLHAQPSCQKRMPAAQGRRATSTDRTQHTLQAGRLPLVPQRAPRARGGRPLGAGAFPHALRAAACARAPRSVPRAARRGLRERGRAVDAAGAERVRGVDAGRVLRRDLLRRHAPGRTRAGPHDVQLLLRRARQRAEPAGRVPQHVGAPRGRRRRARSRGPSVRARAGRCGADAARAAGECGAAAARRQRHAELHALDVVAARAGRPGQRAGALRRRRAAERVRLRVHRRRDAEACQHKRAGLRPLGLPARAVVPERCLAQPGHRPGCAAAEAACPARTRARRRRRCAADAARRARARCQGLPSRPRSCFSTTTRAASSGARTTWA